MADEKNIVHEDNSEKFKSNEKKKPDKKFIIGIVAAATIIAIVVGIIVGVSSGGKEKYTEKPVSTTAADSQDDSVKHGIINGELTPATTESGNSSSGNSSNSGSSGDSENSSSGYNSDSNSDDKKETTTKAVPVSRKLHIEITMPNDGSNDDVLFVSVNGEQLDLSGGSRDDNGYPVKTDGSVFSFDTENEYKGFVTVEASLQKYGKSASRVSGINDTDIKISLPLNHSEEGYIEID